MPKKKKKTVSTKKVAGKNTAKKKKVSKSTSSKKKAAHQKGKAKKSAKRKSSKKIQKRKQPKSKKKKAPYVPAELPSMDMLIKLFNTAQSRGFITEQEVLYAFPEIEDYLEYYEDFLERLRKIGYI